MSSRAAGVALVVAAGTFAVSTLYAALFAPSHYALAAPAAIPVFFFFVLLNWVAFKFFRHN